MGAPRTRWEVKVEREIKRADREARRYAIERRADGLERFGYSRNQALRLARAELNRG